MTRGFLPIGKKGRPQEHVSMDLQSTVTLRAAAHVMRRPGSIHLEEKKKNRVKLAVTG